MLPKALIERPKKWKKQFWRKKEKKHTPQVPSSGQPKKTGEIICTAYGKERDDFQVSLKLSIASLVKRRSLDKGYQGIQNGIPKSWIPHKTGEGGELTEQAKKENQVRLVPGPLVYINRRLKIFKNFSRALSVTMKTICFEV